MKRRIATTLLALASALPACGPRIRDENDDAEARAACSSFCDISVACNPGSVSICGTPAVDHTECVSLCMEDKRDRWSGECRPKKLASLQCSAALTCDELLAKSACSEIPLDEQPCAVESHELGLCLGEE